MSRRSDASKAHSAPHWGKSGGGQDVFDVAAKAVSPGQWIWDGVHPLPQGHELIARQWLEEVSGRWKAS